MRRFALLALSLLAARPTLHAQDARGTRVDSLVRAEMAKRHIPGMSVAVVKDGKVVKNTAYGMASIELGVPVAKAPVFRIASTTKIITGIAVMLLVQEHKLSVDDTVRALLPSIPATWGGLTVRHLLSHTSGLPDAVDQRLPSAPVIAPTRDSTLALLATMPLEAQPGERWAYNQTNYLLLGMIVEKLSGMSFDEFATRRIFQPLGMTQTTFGDSHSLIAGRGPWYSVVEMTDKGPQLGTTAHPIDATYPSWLHTGAAINTTTDDLVKLDHALDGDGLLSSATRTAMWTNVTMRDGKPLHMDGMIAGWGLGWWVRDVGGGKHGVGMSGGGSTAVQRWIEDKVTVIVLTNLQGAEPESLLDAIGKVYVR